MADLGTIAAFALTRAPEWAQRVAYGRDRPVIDGRAMDWSALAVGRLALRIRPPGMALALEDSRRSLRVLAARLDLPRPASVQVRDLTLPGAVGPLPARVYDTDLGAQGRPAILFLHGGGWVQGGIDTHDGLCGQLALESGLRVIAPEYRLAPENPWPAAPDDVLAVWRGLGARANDLGIDPARVIVAGDSAGANLAAVLVHDLGAVGGAQPRGQALIYPALDAGFATPSMASLAQAFVLPRDRMEWYVNLYLPQGADPFHPRAAPARSPHLAAAPPTLVVTAGHDPLRDDGLQYSQALQATGVRAEHHEFPGQIHAFLSLRRAIPQGRRALSLVADWARVRASG